MKFCVAKAIGASGWNRLKKNFFAKTKPYASFFNLTFKFFVFLL